MKELGFIELDKVPLQRCIDIQLRSTSQIDLIAGQNALLDIVRDLIQISVLTGETIIMQPHILGGPKDKANLATILSRTLGVFHLELDVVSTFSTLTAEYTLFPSVVQTFGHLLDIDTETTFRTNQIPGKGTFSADKDIAHGGQFLAHLDSYRKNIIAVLEQILKELDLIGVHLLLGSHGIDL